MDNDPGKRVARFAKAAGAACQRALSAKVSRVQTFPALPGRMRRSVRVHLGERSVIATHRGSVEAGEREAEVLRVLSSAGAPVPALVAFSDGWVIQEDGGPCLFSVALDGSDQAEGEAWLDKGLTSLAAILEVARSTGFADEVARRGPDPELINANLHASLPEQPTLLGERVGVSPPALPEARLAALLRSDAWHFCKWDASPGNAAIRGDGSLAWFDWALFGSRNPLDDVAWLLCNAFVPEWPEAEEKLLERHLAAFHDGPIEEGARYLSVFGTLRLCYQLNWFLGWKGDGPWWDHARCVAGDIRGPSQKAVDRLLSRAARWAVRAPETEALAPFLERVAELGGGK